MSRSTAKLLHTLARAATALQTPQRRQASLARLIEGLNETGGADVPTPRGPLKMLPLRGPHVAAALKWDHEEPETLAWIGEVQRGQTLWDVGAQIGFGALYAGLGGVKVLAFEPKATSFALMAEHVAINGLAELITPLCVALSDTTRLSRLVLSTLGPGSWNNSLEGTSDQFGRRPEGVLQGVPEMRGDDLISTFGLQPPDHLKIDVDGVEGAVLAGLHQTLPRVRTLLIEVEGENADHAAERIDAPLAAAGFAEDVAFRGQGSGRNRLYRNASLG
ncbi:MAG: FkbM family methyltransferase [Caulobacteraceae bacterium]